jgi:hypothetical protein
MKTQERRNHFKGLMKLLIPKCCYVKYDGKDFCGVYNIEESVKHVIGCPNLTTNDSYFCEEHMNHSLEDNDYMEMLDNKNVKFIRISITQFLDVYDGICKDKDRVFMLENYFGNIIIPHFRNISSLHIDLGISNLCKIVEFFLVSSVHKDFAKRCLECIFKQPCITNQTLLIDYINSHIKTPFDEFKPKVNLIMLTLLKLYPDPLEILMEENWLENRNNTIQEFIYIRDKHCYIIRWKGLEDIKELGVERREHYNIYYYIDVNNPLRFFYSYKECDNAYQEHYEKLRYKSSRK